MDPVRTTELGLERRDSRRAVRFSARDPQAVHPRYLNASQKRMTWQIDFTIAVNSSISAC
jgi:hypothetical protein